MPTLPNPIPQITNEEITRFWSKISRKGPDDCWEWIPSLGNDPKKKRYPMFQVWHDKKTINIKASRLAYFLGTGKDLGLLFGCHSCDNRRCCNFNHIFPGNNTDNMQDAARKGRVVSGDAHYTRRFPELVQRGDKAVNATITSEIALAIYLASGTKAEIAARFGAAKHHVGDIKKRRRWKHVTEGIEPVWYTRDKPGRKVGDPWRKVS